MTTYKNIEAFYDEDPRRRASPEVDYGAQWTNGPKWPHWRVSYVQATGEVYAVQLMPPERVEILGVSPPDPSPDYYHTLDKVLRGWAEGDKHELAWVRFRLQKAAWVRNRLQRVPGSPGRPHRSVNEELAELF